jgi:hypothetical protein
VINQCVENKGVKLENALVYGSNVQDSIECTEMKSTFFRIEKKIVIISIN